MIQHCSKCKNYDISISDEPCRKCQQAFRRGEGKPNFIASITNADRIRGMTDEEMAEFIAYSTSCETCVVRKGGSDECHNTNCSTAWLDWLKEKT